MLNIVFFQTNVIELKYNNNNISNYTKMSSVREKLKKRQENVAMLLHKTTQVGNIF